MCNGNVYAGVFTELQRNCEKGKAFLNIDSTNNAITANLQVKGQRNSYLKQKLTDFLERHFTTVKVSIQPLPRFQCIVDKHIIYDKSL